MPPVFAGMEQAQHVAVRIAQPRLAPQPALLGRQAGEGDARGLQLRDTLVEPRALVDTTKPVSAGTCSTRWIENVASPSGHSKRA
jgi:hypothetical protein